MKHPVHTKLLSLVQSERKIKIEILNYLEKAEALKIYVPKYFNIFDYCRKELGYTDSEAMRRISTMRFLRRHKELKPKVIDESISVSQLNELNKAELFLKREGKGEMIDTIIPLIENKSVRDTKEIINQELNITSYKKVSLTVEDETYEKWVTLKNHHYKLSDDKLLNLMIEAANKLQNIPVVVRKEVQDSRIASPNMRKAKLQEAGFKCQYPGCNNISFLQIDHIHPWSLGGKTERMNLQVLCQTHNLMKGKH